LFDVVLVKDVPKLEILAALRRVYDGSHLTHRAVMYTRAAHVQIACDQPLGIELDGEYAVGRDLVFTPKPAVLRVLA
jgi:diacylglycerol kinase (ATP)